MAEARFTIAELLKENAILRERLGEIPPRERPHYTPGLRWRICRFKEMLGLSIDETCKRFLIARSTLSRWLKEARENAGTRTIGKLLRPFPPIRRIAEGVRDQARLMVEVGFGGNGLVARILTRSGIKTSKSSVAHFRKEKPGPRQPKPSRNRTADRTQTVMARFVGDVWLVDVSEIKGLFGLFRFKVVAILDVFSRFPVALEVFSQEPKARHVVRLLKDAVAKYGPPKTLVTDQGRQFTASPFEMALRRLGIQHRLGAVGRSGSIAIIERFWRTLKERLSVRYLKPLTEEDIRCRLGHAQVWYSHYRPHLALDDATPAEVFKGKTPLHLAAIRAPRGPRGSVPLDMPFDIEYLDPELRFPILVPKEKAA